MAFEFDSSVDSPPNVAPVKTEDIREVALSTARLAADVTSPCAVLLIELVTELVKAEKKLKAPP